jgi:hypothetical protein
MISKIQNIAKKVPTPKDVSAIVPNTAGNYGNHPFFVKKAAADKLFLEKVGLPKQPCEKIKE